MRINMEDTALHRAIWVTRLSSIVYSIFRAERAGATGQAGENAGRRRRAHAHMYLII